MTVSCRNCDQTWPRDPVLEVECPMCGADEGTKCKRPSGHSGNFVHPHGSRDKLARKEVDDYNICPEQESRENQENLIDDHPTQSESDSEVGAEDAGDTEDNSVTVETEQSGLSQFPNHTSV